MRILLFDDHARQSLLPLTYTRPVADLRIGILTIAEKWAKRFNTTPYSFLTADYLQPKFPSELAADNLLINGSVCPDEELCTALNALKIGEALVKGDLLLAVRLDAAGAKAFDYNSKLYTAITYAHDFVKITYPEDIFKLNDIELRKDFNLITAGRTSAKLDPSNTILGTDFFAEEGAVAYCSTFNTLVGPIYLAADTQVWEGSHIRGSFALCEHSQVKMGAKIYGSTTIGPHCRIGGEVSNAVLQAYSSKGHEGFLGNSVLGEWCNIGADTNNSNLKNNYAEVRLWDYGKQSFRKTGLQFCGLIMADHAKCGINTMFNTGTVVGVSANVFGAGYPRNFVPDFAWGGAQGYEVYALNKVFETADLVFQRRNRAFDQVEKDILTKVFELTEQYRRF
jgi:UDP-N-acetylglucosamine diphosphorylase/glucosamine-1-phosphate N-acetyltransferase